MDRYWVLLCLCMVKVTNLSNWSGLLIFIVLYIHTSKITYIVTEL